jgi:vacuolar-type H+-ATPase subunit F/Vma7
MFRDPSYYKAEPTFLTSSDIYSEWLDGILECRVISPKAENLPVVQPVAHLNDSPIFGIIGINPVAESAIIDLKGVLIKGELPSEGGILVSEVLMTKLKLKVGDELVLNDLTNKQAKISLRGVFDDIAFSELRDIDGLTYLPMKLLDVTPEASPTFLPTSCNPSEIIIVNLSTALTMPLVGITRVDIAVGEETDVKAFAERLALERGYKVWFSSADGVYFTKLGGYMEVKALPLIVPWGIVTLNVMMTMLNSIYERKKEICILSSVGLNPSQISTIFIAEASIIGIIAGGTGYLIGLSLYRVIAFFGLAIEVRQKVSALWSFATICIAMTAVVTGTIPVLKNSTDVTPSSMRRWRIDESQSDADEPFEITIPVKLLPEEINTFSDFVVRALKAHNDPVRKISSVSVFADENENIKRVGFVYKAKTSLDAGTFFTNNILIIEKMPKEDVKVRLQSDGSKNHVYTTGNLIRMFAMQWSTIRGKPILSGSEN